MNAEERLQKFINGLNDLANECQIVIEAPGCDTPDIVDMSGDKNDFGNLGYEILEDKIIYEAFHY